MWIIYMIVFDCFLQCSAVRRGGTSKSRVGTKKKSNIQFEFILREKYLGAYSYSAGNSVNENQDDLGRAILAIVFMVLSCGGGIAWKIYRCLMKNRRRKFNPPIPYPNNIYLDSQSTVNFFFKINSLAFFC